MGVQDRDWYKEHAKRNDAVRNATYAPKAFRRSSEPTADRRGGPGSITLRAIVLWAVLGLVIFAGMTAVLKPQERVADPAHALPTGLPSGQLTVICEPMSLATAVQLRQLDAAGEPNGVEWTIRTASGTTATHQIPEGRYRIEVIRKRGWMPETVDVLPQPIEFRSSGGRTAGGSLRI